MKALFTDNMQKYLDAKDTRIKALEAELAELKQAMWDRGRSHSRTVKENDRLRDAINAEMNQMQQFFPNAARRLKRALKQEG